MKARVPQEIKDEFIKIVKGIDLDQTFDSHFVIESFFRSGKKKNADLYLKYCFDDIALWHSELSKVVAELEGDLVERVGEKHVSFTLIGTASPNMLWRKTKPKE